MDAAAAVAEAKRLDESAREHKHLAARHRRMAREDREALARLRAELAERGIQLETQSPEEAE